MEFENVMSNDFWLTSGWHLTVRDNHGHMVPSADFMRAYFMREEVAPEEGSCDAEIALHKKLVDDPFAAVVPTVYLKLLIKMLCIIIRRFCGSVIFWRIIQLWNRPIWKWHAMPSQISRRCFLNR